MARPLRIEVAGAWYHVTARGNERRCIYRHDRDRVRFMELVEESVDRFRWSIHGYVLMDNHYHLQLELKEPNLSEAMRWLHVSYSVYFNLRYRRSGHLFQGRFKSVLVDPESWGVRLSQYLHLNPIRIKALGQDRASRKARSRAGHQQSSPAEVRRRLARLGEYRWSSYPAYIGKVEAPDWLTRDWILSRMGVKSEKARAARYQKQIEEAACGQTTESPWSCVKGGLLGAEEWVEEMRELGVKTMDRREQPQAKALDTRPSWESIVKLVETEKGEKWERFRDRYGDDGRDAVLHLARVQGGLKLRRLGELCGGLDYRTVSRAVTLVRRRRQQQRKFDEWIQSLETKIMEI